MSLSPHDEVQLRRLTGLAEDCTQPLPEALVDLYTRWQLKYNKIGANPADPQVLALMVVLTENIRPPAPPVVRSSASDRMARARAAKKTKAAPQLQTNSAPELALT